MQQFQVSLTFEQCLCQVAFVAGTEYTTIQLISVTVALGTQMIHGQPYQLSPKMVSPCVLIKEALMPLISVQKLHCKDSFLTASASCLLSSTFKGPLFP